jgi:hypothetical protein
MIFRIWLFLNHTRGFSIEETLSQSTIWKNSKSPNHKPFLIATLPWAWPSCAFSALWCHEYNSDSLLTIPNTHSSFPSPGSESTRPLLFRGGQMRSQSFGFCISYFLITLTMPDLHNLKEEGFILAPGFRGFSSWLPYPMSLGRRSRQEEYTEEELLTWGWMGSKMWDKDLGQV